MTWTFAQQQKNYLYHLKTHPYFLTTWKTTHKIIFFSTSTCLLIWIFYEKIVVILTFKKTQLNTHRMRVKLLNIPRVSYTPLRSFINVKHIIIIIIQSSSFRKRWRKKLYIFFSLHGPRENHTYYIFLCQLFFQAIPNHIQSLFSLQIMWIL